MRASLAAYRVSVSMSKHFFVHPTHNLIHALPTLQQLRDGLAQEEAEWKKVLAAAEREAGAAGCVHT